MLLSLEESRESFIDDHNQPLSDILLLKSPDGREGLEPRSKLLLTLLLDDLLRRNLISFGSAVSSPPTLANKIKISVKLTTPTRWPLIRAPGSALAEMEGPEGDIVGVLGDASATWSGSDEVACGGWEKCCPGPRDIDELCDDSGAMVAVCSAGVGGPDDIGDMGSVIHMR